MTKQAEQKHIFTSNENGLRFEVNDPVTLRNVSNPEKKEIVTRLQEETKKGKNTNGKEPEAPKDNEQEIK